MVYVLNINGEPLMPTNRHGKVRRLLRDNKAKVVKKSPFTIQLLYETSNFKQEISLGVDSGSKHIGLSSTTTNEVLFEADVELRNDIVDLISTRREFRRSRRNRKTRYRKARFNNRKKKENWLAPSIQQKIDSHITMIGKVNKILPISKTIVEVASFDIQKIKNPNISGKEYQEGEQLDFWNLREYIFFRDNYQCQCCKGKSKDKILNVHHIESRKTGGNAPNNLVTLCETCHKDYHKGKIKLPKTIKRGMSFKDATFMGIMRWSLYEKLKTLYPNVSLTYGYITKNTRIKNNLPKDHYIDARCISGNPLAKSNGEVYHYKKVRCHNRQIFKAKILKGGIKKRNQAPYEVLGFRLYDKVLWKGIKCFIFGRRSTGRMDLRLLDGTKINASVAYKNLKLLNKRGNYLIEIRKGE
jgi:N6-L-threonylcarbamoyladenine synthase